MGFWGAAAQETALRKEIIGDATLYLGDCKSILPGLGQVNAVVTDPPYGININAQFKTVEGQFRGHGNRRIKSKIYTLKTGDEKTEQDLIDQIRDNSRHQIIFGGNYYKLPPTRCWLIWDKLNGSNTYADCEMAWTNLEKSVRKIDWLWNGMARRNLEKRYEHPSQKPLGVMQWCINHLPDDAQTILDPFMGSGTTGVAALNLGRKFIGIEKEAEYFEIACKRISDAERQADFFHQGHKQEQLQLAYA